MRSSLFLRAAAVLPALAASLGFAQTVVETTPPAVMKLDVGAVYSRGDYGLTQDTTVFAVPVTFSYEAGPWTWRVTAPWIMIDGPASVIGEGAAASGPLRPNDASESGLGDSSVSVSYKLNPGADRLNIDVTGRVKLPTGDEDRGIGTGEVDTYAQVDLYRTLGTVTPFGTVGYRWLGDGLYQLENGLYASGGLLFNVATGTTVGASYEWRDAIVVGGDDASEGSLLVFQRFNEHWSGSFTVMKGFTDASADFGVSATISHSF